MSRRRYILEQVFTRAGCTRYLHTFGSSGARSDRTYKYTWSLEKERERRKKGERFEIHPQRERDLSSSWMLLEMLISARKDPFGFQLLAILF